MSLVALLLPLAVTALFLWMLRLSPQVRREMERDAMRLMEPSLWPSVRREMEPPTTVSAPSRRRCAYHDPLGRPCTCQGVTR